jgi:hypothetical protein
MSITVADEARDAAKLVRYACQPRLRPLADKTYHKLLERYRSSSGFRELVDAIADGLTLLIVAAHPEEGIVALPHPDGIFTYRLSDYQKGIKPSERMLVGLIHVAIAARAYPTPVDLEEEAIKRVSVAEVDTFIRHLIKEMSREAEDESGLAAISAEFKQAWRSYDKLTSHRIKAGKGNGLSPTCTHYWITNVLDWLVVQGLAQRATEFGPGHYRLLHRFRLQVAEAAGQVVYEKLADVRRRQTADSQEDGEVED